MKITVTKYLVIVLTMQDGMESILLGGDIELLIDVTLGDLSMKEPFLSPKGEALSLTGVLQIGVELPLLKFSPEPLDL